jgi:hypothetical protein
LNQDVLSDVYLVQKGERVSIRSQIVCCVLYSWRLDKRPIESTYGLWVFDEREFEVQICVHILKRASWISRIHDLYESLVDIFVFRKTEVIKKVLRQTEGSDIGTGDLAQFFDHRVLVAIEKQVCGSEVLLRQNMYSLLVLLGKFVDITQDSKQLPDGKRLVIVVFILPRHHFLC